MDREAWRAAIHWVAKSRTQLSDWSDLIWSSVKMIFKCEEPCLVLNWELGQDLDFLLRNRYCFGQCWTDSSALSPGAPATHLPDGSPLSRARTHRKQLATVSTHCFEMREAAQTWDKPWRMLTCQGHCPTLASRPETMPDKTAGRPQTADGEERGLEACPGPCPRPASPRRCPLLGTRPLSVLPGHVDPEAAPYLTWRDPWVPPHLCLQRKRAVWGTPRMASYLQGPLRPPPGLSSPRVHLRFPTEEAVGRRSPQGPCFCPQSLLLLSGLGSQGEI